MNNDGIPMPISKPSRDGNPVSALAHGFELESPNMGEARNSSSEQDTESGLPRTDVVDEDDSDEIEARPRGESRAPSSLSARCLDTNEGW